MRTLASLVLLASFAWAGDLYFGGSLGDVEILDGKPPVARGWRYYSHHPWIALDGPGEAHIAHHGANVLRIALRVPEARDVTGLVVLPGDDSPRIRFRVPASALDPEAGEVYAEIERLHYEGLSNRSLAGGAWFRHRAMTARREERPGRWRQDDWQRRRTFDFYTGGAALTENLQLRRGLPGGKRAEPTVPVDSIRGITVAEFDWAAHAVAAGWEADPLALHVPADQYAIFFPSFRAMLDLVDLADGNAASVLHAMEPRAQDLGTRAKYERQLCLETDALSRLFGPELIASVAFTSSDPYLREGTDVAVLFEAVQPEVLSGILTARRKAKAGPAATETTATIAGRTVHVLKTPDRAVHSLLARTGGVVVVANSAVQMERILGEGPKLAKAPEYAFFRQRYPRAAEGESALLVVPDAAIRKWCGPRWRIASSRRVRAAATLAELSAEHRDALLADEAVADVDAAWAPVDCGALRVEGGQVRSSIYNTAAFLTPIAELDVESATEDEARFYKMWRDGYERNWSNYFDPIAVRLTASEQRIAADVTVMPLLMSTEYRQYLEIVKNARISADGADRHAEALLQWAIAIDTDSPVVKQWGSFLHMLGGKLDVHPLSWLGQSVSLYVDRDPFLDEVLQAEDKEAFFEKNVHRLPAALYCEVRSPLKLAAFLATVRAFVQQSAPGLTVWENREHHGQAYVRVGPTPQGAAQMGGMDRLAVYYAALPDGLVVTLSEDVLRRAIDRLAERPEGEAPPDRGAPWLGEHLCLHADRAILELFHDEFRRELQDRCWGNLPILNEWRRLYPDRDPLDVHERLFGARLVCPGGGRYFWDEEWRTMASTAFGHPGKPLEGPADLTPFAGWSSGNFGLTFENDGLRAICELAR